MIVIEPREKRGGLACYVKFSVSYVTRYLIRFWLQASRLVFVEVCCLTSIFRINLLLPLTNLIN